MSNLMFIALLGANMLLLGLYWHLFFQRKLQAKVAEINDHHKVQQGNEQRYKQIIEASDVGIAVFKDSKFVYINNKLSKKLGSYSSSYIINTDIRNHLHPDDVQQMLIRQLAVLQNARYTNIETRFFTQDNLVFHAEVSLMPIRFESADAVLMLVRDVSERKKREDTFARQQRTMNTILEHAPIGIWMLGTDRKIQFMNQNFASKIGIAADAFLNAEHYSTLLPHAVSQRFMQSDGECIRSMNVHFSHETIACVDGTDHVFEIVKAPILDDDKTLLGVVTLAIDVTERIHAEQEKDKMQRQVEHTQRLESMGVLAGGIAHDFNNILTSILGNASILKHNISNINDAQKLGNIISASERAANLCRQMLAYSGKGHFVIEVIDMSDILKDMVQLLEVSIEKHAHLEYELEQKLPKVEADVAQLQQVIMNLVINASEAIEHQHGHITVRTGLMDADSAYLSQCHADDIEAGEYIYLEVQDNGSGMSQDVQSKVFEPFFTTKFTGRGLGMSAILGIVKGHHGALLLTSEAGQGTTFRVLFPTSGYFDAVENTDITVIREIPKTLKGTVLVVDDEAMVLEVSTALLKRMGFDVLQAKDGEKGVEIYNAHKADISMVLLDLTMPRMSGKECFFKLREVNKDVPVLFSSGYSEEDSMRGFEQHHVSFVQKPYSPEVLQQRAYQLLRDAHEDS
ncbi:MAG: PAS domain S-box protein [Mariprofundaceae bacterium]|nr:PAS domain S-box protein [Mariprofundaceae bacterium]